MLALADPTRRPTPRASGLPVSDEVEAIFARALSVSPPDRPGVRELWQALERASAG